MSHSTKLDPRIPIWWLTSAIVVLLAACSDASPYTLPDLSAPTRGGDDPADGGSSLGSIPSFPTTGIGATRLTLTGIEPASAPYSGGTVAVLRGSGFVADAEVRIGGVAVQPGEVSLESPNRLRVVVPAGMLGPAEVRVSQGEDSDFIDGGFFYNGLEISPPSGSISGGTLVEIEAGAETFDQDVVVEFDGAPCTDVGLISPKRLRCKTPRHAVGPVDVVARWLDDAHEALTARAGYAFVETLDAERGGLSGGPITGTLNVAVMNDLGFVVPDAWVVVGNDLTTEHKGRTDERGSIVFSGDDLKGPLTVHASAKCYQKGTIVDFDAVHVTLILSAAFDLSCASDSGGTPRRGALGSLIAGELVFPGAEEFGVNNWNIVPEPRANEIRVAYVFTTRASSEVRNPAPDPAGTTARLAESTAEIGSRGFKYKIFARPAGLAVYALAGLERTDTGQFTPYVMGLARNVVTSPGDMNDGVNVIMDVSLDRELSVGLRDYPEPSSSGPSEFRVRAHVDLGGEGVIVREVGNRSFDILTRRVGSESFRFFGQPSFSDLLKDASYEVVAGYYTAEVDLPLTNQRKLGVLQSGEPIEFSKFLGIPRATVPSIGGQLPPDRVLRFELEGEQPDLIIIDIADSTGFPVWSQVLPGTARAVPIPDFSVIEGQADIAQGFFSWAVTAVKIAEFKYNEFRYGQLSSRFFTHTAANVLTARR
jgi:hypothetical protein